ncbi:MAG: hypothetical protein K6E20_04180 [Acholeplasmatales bacterium]|nr:hypothetical protein [Acholeplasmatales bacterium]
MNCKLAEIFDSNKTALEKYNDVIKTFKSIPSDERASMNDARYIELLYEQIDFDEHDRRFSLGGRIISKFITKRVLMYSLVGYNVAFDNSVRAYVVNRTMDFDKKNNTDLLYAFYDIVFDNLDSKYQS